MPPLRLTRQMLIVGAGIILAIALLLTIASLFFKKQPVIEDVKVTNDQAVNRVFIKDFYTYGDYLKPERQRVVENVLYAFVSKNIPDLYTGSIRQNTFSQAKDSNGTLRTTFLVDVSPANVTYTIAITGTSKDDPKPILIQCAPKDQQKDPSAICVDGVQRRE